MANDTADSDSVNTSSRLGASYRPSELEGIPKPEYLISDILYQPATALLVGPKDVGKSFLVISWACSVATGVPWVGSDVLQRKVLLFVGEGASGLDSRIKSWSHEYNKGKLPPDEYLEIREMPMSIKEDTFWNSVIPYAIAEDYGLVILDTVSSLAYDADETKDAPKIVRGMSELASSINGLVVGVHHTGWDQDILRARGGYQWEANTDQVLTLGRVTQDSDSLVLTRKHVKDGSKSGQRQRLRLSESKYAPVIAIDTEVYKNTEEPIKKRVLELLGDCRYEGASGKQVRDALGVSYENRSSVGKARRELEQEGLVVSVGSGNHVKYFLYEYAPANFEAKDAQRKITEEIRKKNPRENSLEKFSSFNQRFKG